MRIDRVPTEFDRWLLEQEHLQEARERRLPTERLQAERDEEIVVTWLLQWQADKQGFGSWSDWAWALSNGLEPLPHLRYEHKRVLQAFQRRRARLDRLPGS